MNHFELEKIHHDTLLRMLGCLLCEGVILLQTNEKLLCNLKLAVQLHIFANLIAVPLPYSIVYVGESSQFFLNPSVWAKPRPE